MNENFTISRSLEKWVISSHGLINKGSNISSIKNLLGDSIMIRDEEYHSKKFKNDYIFEKFNAFQTKMEKLRKEVSFTYQFMIEETIIQRKLTVEDKTIKDFRIIYTIGSLIEHPQLGQELTTYHFLRQTNVEKIDYFPTEFKQFLYAPIINRPDITSLPLVLGEDGFAEILEKLILYISKNEINTSWFKSNFDCEDNPFYKHSPNDTIFDDTGQKVKPTRIFTKEGWNLVSKNLLDGHYLYDEIIGLSGSIAQWRLRSLTVSINNEETLKENEYFYVSTVDCNINNQTLSLDMQRVSVRKKEKVLYNCKNFNIQIPINEFFENVLSSVSEYKIAKGRHFLPCVRLLIEKKWRVTYE